jgi:F-type H+-transporting ATPase subunit delta
VAERIEAGARVYARALYEAAVDGGRVAEVDRDLRAFATVLAENRDLLRTLLNPQLPREAKRRVVAELMRDADQLAKNGVLVMVDNSRLNLVGDVQHAFSDLAAVEEEILDVEVTTAVPLDAAQVSDLEGRISKATGLTARMTASVDPDIIGGLVLRARGVLLDASVKRELEDLRRALLTTPLPIGSEA